MNEARTQLTQRLKHDEADGQKLSGALTKEQFFELRPYMIDVNSMVDGVQTMSKRNSEEAATVLKGLEVLFRDKLGSAFKLEFPEEQSKGEGKAPV